MVGKIDYGDEKNVKDAAVVSNNNVDDFYRLDLFARHAVPSQLEEASK